MLFYLILVKKVNEKITALGGQKSDDLPAVREFLDRTGAIS
jgi:hypothetical protein